MHRYNICVLCIGMKFIVCLHKIFDHLTFNYCISYIIFLFLLHIAYNFRVMSVNSSYFALFFLVSVACCIKSLRCAFIYVGPNGPWYTPSKDMYIYIANILVAGVCDANLTILKNSGHDFYFFQPKV